MIKLLDTFTDFRKCMNKKFQASGFESTVASASNQTSFHITSEPLASLDVFWIERDFSLRKICQIKRSFNSFNSEFTFC